MHRLYRFRTNAKITLKRLWAQRGLTAALVLGLSVAVALIMVVPLFADAINFHLLETRLSQAEEGQDRPPFSYLYLYQGAWSGLSEWESVQPVINYIDNSAVDTLGIPADEIVHYVQTDAFRLFPNDGSETGTGTEITSIRYAWLSNLQNHINIVEGEWPSTADSEPYEVLISTRFAEEHGLTVGSEYRTTDPRTPSGNRRQFIAKVSGLWEPIDVEEDYWFSDQETLAFLFFVPLETFRDQLAEELPDEVYTASWYLIMDGSNVGTEMVDGLISGEQTLIRQLDRKLPGTRDFISLEDELLQYRQEVQALTTRLIIYNIPSIVLILAFIWLVIGLSVEQQRNEIAVAVSRGGSTRQIVGMSLLQGIIVGILAFILGTILALLFTQVMGRVRTFLDFSAASNLRIILTPTAVRVGVIAVVLAIIAQIAPTISASRHTIVTYKQDQARSLKPPWWQRYFLDLILFAVVAYGYWQLRQSGSLVSFDAESQASDVFQNPIFLLLPSLITFAVTLFFLRIMPFLLRLLDKILMRTNNVPLLQATRYLSRLPGQYAAPLVLLTLTLSLSFFTASLARTLDLQLFDQEHYANGADVSLVTNYFYLLQGGEPESYLPPEAYEEINGVETATRIGNFNAVLDVGDTEVTGEYLGIDWNTFNEVSYWRSDFSDYRLGTLMNQLGNHPDGVLIPTALMEELGLEGGDFIPVTVDADGTRVNLDLKIVGTFDYFPTWYESRDGALFVANLEHLFEEAGGEIVFQVWLNTAENFDEENLQTELNLRRLNTTTWTRPETAIDIALKEPARQGIFGLLSVGFIAAAILTVLGYFLYALFSMRRRMIEIGIMQAVGLSTRKMIGLVAWEMALLILTGVVLGTFLGITISQLFIPAIQVGAALTENTPPYLVENFLECGLSSLCLIWTAVPGSTVYFIGYFAADEFVPSN